MLPRDVEGLLHTSIIGRRLYYYPETDSTNDRALAMAREGEPEGGVVYTDFQRHGRGRLDRAWHSPRGKDLLFSVVLRPPGEPRDALPVTLVVSLAIAITLGKRLDVDVGVKWPNDVVVGAGKIAGILAQGGVDEGGDRFLVVGVGVNVGSSREDFAPEIRGRAASCRTLSDEEIDRGDLLGDILTAVEGYYDRFRADGFAPLMSVYEERLSWQGREVRFERDNRACSGVVAGVRSDGALRVKAPDGAEMALYGETVEVAE